MVTAGCCHLLKIAGETDLESKNITHRLPVLVILTYRNSHFKIVVV